MPDYIKVSRALLSHPVFSDEWLLKLFLWCLMKAEQQDNVVEGIQLRAGEFITSRFRASSELNANESRVYRGLRKLEDMGCIELESNTAHTSIFVCKYAQYQNETETNNQNGKLVRKRTASPKPVKEAIIEKPEEKVNSHIAIEVNSLSSWLEWWNTLHGEGLVSAKVDPNKPSMGVQAGWKRVSASAALRDLLKDRAALADQIRNSSFCREEWFRVERLFGGKNKDGEWIIQKLLDGGYRDKTPKNGTMKADPLGNMAFREAYLKEIEQGGGDERERSNDC